jgi:PTH1 family peptidyl-tRNA hydrolase
VLLVVGLGNPGADYATHRHNIGFRVAAAFRETAGLGRFTREGDAEVSRGRRRGRPVVVARPLAYMNRSGEVVDELLRREKAAAAELLVVVDDLYLPLARIRLRPGGGDGGHQGLRSIIESLGDGGFPRLRFGIGAPEAGRDIKEWVLESFSAAEESVVAPAVATAVEVIDAVLTGGLDLAMSRFNAPVAGATGSEEVNR